MEMTLAEHMTKMDNVSSCYPTKMLTLRSTCGDSNSFWIKSAAFWPKSKKWSFKIHPDTIQCGAIAPLQY